MIFPWDRRVGWTDERIARLRELSARGLSARQIGMELGVSKNAVISKANRIGLESRRLVKSGPKPKGSARAKKLISGLLKPNGRHSRLPPSIGNPIFAEPIRFMELEPHHCRWPLGEGPILFCGVSKYETSSYCAYHARLSYAPSARKVA